MEIRAAEGCEEAVRSARHTRTIGSGLDNGIPMIGKFPFIQKKEKPLIPPDCPLPRASATACSFFRRSIRSSYRPIGIRKVQIRRSSKKPCRKRMEPSIFGMAGTSVRFYLAFATIRGIPIRIDASGRGRERPVQALFQALRMLGGSWHFEGEEDHFPCQVKNGPLAGGYVVIDTSVSSQFATALMLTAPLCPKGIRAEFKGKRSSTPYLELTRQLMEELGLSLDLTEDEFSVPSISRRSPRNGLF